MNKLDIETFFTAEDKEHLDTAYGRSLAQADEIQILQQQVEQLMKMHEGTEQHPEQLRGEAPFYSGEPPEQPKPQEVTISKTKSKLYPCLGCETFNPAQTISKTETVEKGRIETAREYLLSKGYLDVPDSRFMHNMTELCTLMDKFANSLREQWQREAWEARMEKGKPIKQIHGLGWYDQSEIIETVKYPTFEDFWNRDNSSRDGKEDK